MNSMRSTDTKLLKKRMIDKGIDSISELSKQSGVGRDTIGRLLAGDIQPSAPVMYSIASALKLSPEEAGRIFFNSNLRNA